MTHDLPPMDVHTASEFLSEDSVELLAPVDSRAKLVGLALNCREHTAESGHSVPEQSRLFAKFTNTIIICTSAITVCNNTVAAGGGHND